MKMTQQEMYEGLLFQIQQGCMEYRTMRNGDVVSGWADAVTDEGLALRWHGGGTTIEETVPGTYEVSTKGKAVILQYRFKAEEVVAPKRETLYFSLGFIGHDKKEKLEALFSEYSTEPNEYGYYLKFQTYSEYVVNKGIMVETNCWDSEEDFKERLYHNMLCNL